MACGRPINLQQGILSDSWEGVANKVETRNTEQQLLSSAR
jgi:hypothetical protein